MKFFIAIVTLALCASAFAEDEEKNVDKRTVIVGTYGIDNYYRSLFYNYYPSVPAGVHILKKRDTADVENTEEEKDIDKRAILLSSSSYYSSLYYPSYYNYARIYKRDTAAVEENTEEKNIDKRAIIYDSSVLPYWYRAYNPYAYSPLVTYPFVKRETEEASEGSEHNVQKREVNEEEAKTENKRDLYLGYGYYGNYYRSFPYYNYYGGAYYY